jgi:hypothetical protein
VVQTAAAQTFEFIPPSDDRWHYPFASSGGTQPEASCFGAVGAQFWPQGWQFNDRDGELIIAWSTAAGIPAGQDPQTYAVQSVTITLTAPASPGFMPAWIPDPTSDEWFTYDINGDMEVNADGVARGQPGDTDGESDDADPGRPIEMFGCGFGPVYTPSGWNELSPYIGADSVVNTARDPYPLAYRINEDGTADTVHVEDSAKGLHNEQLDPPLFSFTPQPWATGIPMGYAPGAQIQPFAVQFEIDLCLSDARVRRYFQEGLSAGRVAVIVTSMKEEAAFGQSDPAQRHIFVTKDGAGSGGLLAPRLSIELGPPAPDCNDNGIPDACELAGGGAADCNCSGAPDECDIASGSSADQNADGVPDECVCTAAADCADVDGDGVRDDNCLWWDCTCGTCAATPIAFADMGGFNGSCAPDGAADGNDRFHALNCFANVNTFGQSGYPCEDAPPQAYNVDAGGQFGTCQPDGVCDGNDAFAALNAFSGVSTCSCSPPGPAPGGPAALRRRADLAEPGRRQSTPEVQAIGRTP